MKNSIIEILATSEDDMAQGLKIIQMPIGTLRPYDKNPRVNDDAIGPVAKSISEFGFRSPIVVDKDNVIICGHTRLKAAQKLGLATVPVHVAADLSPEQVKALRLVDNRTSELSRWDLDLLGLEVEDLGELNFSIDDFGFSELELAQILGEKDPVRQGRTDPDAAPETGVEPISKRGEVYILGRHRVMCGDATDKNDLIRLMAGGMVDLYLVDPPYNVALTGSTGLTIQNDDMGDGEFRNFLTRAFTAAAEVIKPGASFYIFHSDSESANFRLACRDTGLDVHQTLYWVKNNFVLGRFDYHYMSESVLYGWKAGEAHRWFNDRCQTNILNFNKPKCNTVHPTMKPVEMLVYLVKNSSARGDIVLDTFGGSGSTLIAAEQTNRVAFLMELDERYVDVIRKRYAEFRHGEGCAWDRLTPAEG